MNLFTKLNRYIDYNNSYTIKKALSTLSREFNIAIKSRNIPYARAVISATKQIQDRLRIQRETEEYSETMSYAQKILVRKIDHFISYCSAQLKTNFNISDDANEIEQTI